ncbi:glycosyltransferase family 2 protein [Niabella soli]|uniref:Glycosyl transferase family 2 n=1 Tax=Niabella soli DSM 19437 TaxID=929713 RepID=W0EZ51_9BACT|nr:glycosyltransferase family 2 protein [Niabella soli]AHF16085.1 glycosyl transferase family 2 [Niabella soli DSM 19437]
MNPSKKLTVSLVIATYNWPQALECSLKSVLRQSRLPDEVIIADDGSTPQTAALIETYRALFPVPLLHIWQPDEGFQLARIRNKAIAAAQSDYIVQIDGDLVLHRNFISDHCAFSEPGFFATGGRVLLGKSFSEKVLAQPQKNISFFNKGIKNRKNSIRYRPLTRLFKNYRASDVFYLRGCNMAFWRKDLLNINGYNEAFTGWGREDNEIVVRLLNSGVQKHALKHGAIAYHIYHPEKERGSLSRNEELLSAAVSGSSKFALLGLNQYL